MLKLTVRAGTNEAVYLVDKDDNAIAKIQVSTVRGNEVGIGIQALQETTILRNKLIPPDSLSKYDTYLIG